MALRGCLFILYFFKLSYLIIRCCLEIRIPKNSITSKQWPPGSTELKKEAFVGKFCLLRGFLISSNF